MNAANAGDALSVFWILRRGSAPSTPLRTCCPLYRPKGHRRRKASGGSKGQDVPYKMIFACFFLKSAMVSTRTINERYGDWWWITSTNGCLWTFFGATFAGWIIFFLLLGFKYYYSAFYIFLYLLFIAVVFVCLRCCACSWVYEQRRKKVQKRVYPSRRQLHRVRAHRKLLGYS